MGRISVMAAAVVVVLVVVMSAGVGVGVGGVLQVGSQDKCRVQGQCRDCIQTVGCVWCMNPKQAGDENCQHPDFVNMTSFCDARDLQNPVNRLELVQDDPLTGAGKASEKTKQDQIIQLKPQRIKLYLRKGMPLRLNLTYRLARDYPVDLYYLMDLSKSMEDDKHHLAQAGKVLAETMKKLTSQFALGFGSFVDKVKMPFTNTTHLNVMKPCPQCANPYSFRNDMKLSQNHEEFTTKVTNASISGNLDHPEGGFDALMQAMVCRDKIGWRDVARRILVFSTDAKFHHAGDGRLAGVVTPNDEQCHLDAKGEYTAFDEYDYPSIGQINKVADENNIYIIFAVLTNFDLYRKLSQSIKTSSFGELKNGSSNVVELIENQYNNISSSVDLTDNSNNDVTIKYRSACKGQHVSDTQKCSNIQEDDTIVFELEITANACPKDGNRSIVEVKTLEDKVILDIEFLCSCDCPQSPVTSKCKNGGAQVCGVCDCPEGYHGRECECGSKNSYDLSEDQEQQNKCKATDKDTKPCSGRGKCVCGICRCDSSDEVTGTHCQCNKLKCMATNGVECSGNGKCDCNECKCHQGYSGPYCECEDTSCIQQESGKVCSGNGRCVCDRCICDQLENVTYTGRYCEDCLSCETGKCNKFKDCVQCEHFGIGPRKHDCSTCDHSEAVESLDEHMRENSRLCMFEDEEGCYLNFTYRYLETNSKDEVFVQAKRHCPESAPILKIVFALIGAIVGIGVLTLVLWKVFTTIHDRREYANFVKERDGTQFPADQNPLYISASTTTQNPMFEMQK